MNNWACANTNIHYWFKFTFTTRAGIVDTTALCHPQLNLSLIVVGHRQFPRVHGSLHVCQALLLEVAFVVHPVLGLNNYMQFRRRSVTNLIRDSLLLTNSYFLFISSDWLGLFSFELNLTVGSKIAPIEFLIQIMPIFLVLPYRTTDQMVVGWTII